MASNMSGLTLGIVTATTDTTRAEPFISSWLSRAATAPSLTVIKNGGGEKYLGTVPAFRHGVDIHLEQYPKVSVIACLHDDLEILDDGWDEKVLRCFGRHVGVGLVGFGGAIGLGRDDLYQAPYDPMQLARIGFRSNLVDAESHGARSLLAEPVACLDGFSQVGRRAFWEGRAAPIARSREGHRRQQAPPWRYLQTRGFIHHFYDGALGCLARRWGWQVYYLPVRCRHLGGQTAVGDAGYQQWALTQMEGGDRGFWETSHRLAYDYFRDVLPLRVP